MPFFKQVEIKSANKYGETHVGIFAKEDIKRDEKIFQCDENDCDYLLPGSFHFAYTSDQVEEIFKNHPEKVKFLRRFMYMVDDDMYDWPKYYMEERYEEPCALFNHSCDSNAGFKLAIHESKDTWAIVATRDIMSGDEITKDYNLNATESDYDAGLLCKCGSANCIGKLNFDQYRNIDWQNRNYKYSSDYVQKRIIELRTKWFSAECKLKNYSKKSQPNFPNNREMGLTALKEIKKNELVAVFSDPSNIKPEAHFIRHSDNPTCYLSENNVFTLHDVKPNTELTLNYSHNSKA